MTAEIPVPPKAVEPSPAPVVIQEPCDVLVTGATGFLGRHLVPQLLAGGRRVRALVRTPGLLPVHLRDERIEVIPGDLSDGEALQRAVAGVRQVVHLATGGGDSWEEIQESMVGGCQRVAEACLDHKVERLVFTSTIAACYLGDEDAPATTAALPCDPEPEGRALYSRGKIACEQLLTEMASRLGLPAVILRPAVVVGQGGPVQHSGVGLWTRDSQCFGWGMGLTPIPFVLVDDVAQAIVRSLEVEQALGQTYELVGDVTLTARDYVRLLRERSGRDFQFHPQPLWLFQLIEIFKWGVKVVIRRPNVTFPSYRDLKSRRLARPLDSSRAKADLGWTPVADRAVFLERAIDWFAGQQAYQPTPSTAAALPEGQGARSQTVSP